MPVRWVLCCVSVVRRRARKIKKGANSAMWSKMTKAPLRRAPPSLYSTGSLVGVKDIGS